MRTKKQALLNGLMGLIFSFGLFGFTPFVQASRQPAVQADAIKPVQPTGLKPVPVLAYYYIWYDSNSWERAKIDYPLRGRYTSDDRAVMRQHIQWAKAAGIDGFIVSWKSTDVLNRRLTQLADLAEEENFKLAIIYQGLDFNRDPLPVERVASDLDVFIERFASRPAFQIFAKPLVIWSGTWKFSTQEIAQVTESRRDKILLLASERNTNDYLRLANLVDGDAYYWSSANPETFPGYQDKLVGMGQAIHQHGGLWIAPAAPGFNAHMIGGTSLVERNNGQTFREEINAAQASSPDALGIISWNEFSENSQIEPSQTYGTEYLKILSDINHLPAPTIGEFDSSEPTGKFSEGLPGTRIMALGGLTFTILLGLIVIARRRV
jgi:Glycosyl hydrolase family 99